MAPALLLAWQVATVGALHAAPSVARTVARARTDVVALNPQWRFVDESKPGAPPVYGVLRVDTANAPAPVAARFHISSSMQALALQLSESDLGGMPLAQVEELNYCTRLVDGPRPYAVTLQINVDTDVTDGDQSWQGRLVYTPAYNGAVIQGEWQCWNTLVGKWWATGGPVAEYAPADNPLPLGTLLAHFPNLGVNATYSVVALKAGDGWRDFLGEASPVAIRIEGERYDVAFGAVPQSTEVLLPVVFNEPQVTPQHEEAKDEGPGNPKDKKEDKKKPNKDAGGDKPGKDKPGKDEPRNDEPRNEPRRNADWGDVDWKDVDWGDLNWGDFNWQAVDWDEVKWDEIDWRGFGWRAEVVRAFVDDVKGCKKQGWEDAGFRNQGQCVAYYVSAHSPVYLTWNRGWNGEGLARDWNYDWGNNWDDDRAHDRDNDRDNDRERRNKRDR